MYIYFIKRLSHNSPPLQLDFHSQSHIIATTVYNMEHDHVSAGEDFLYLSPNGELVSVASQQPAAQTITSGNGIDQHCYPLTLL
jgi:hypothetical protein